LNINPRTFIENVHVVVVEVGTPNSAHYRRRTYFNLPSAQKAVDRATERGHTAKLILCKLVPVESS